MNAGRVELDLVAVGKDQVTAMLRTVDAQLKSTAAAMGTAGASASTMGGKLDALKDAARPVNKVREAFENLKANAALVIGAVVGVAAGIGAIALALSKNMQAIHAWRDAQKDIAVAIVASHEAYRALQIALGNAEADSPLEAGVNKARKRWEELSPLIDKASAAALAYADQIKRIEIGISNDAATRQLAIGTNIISKLEDRMHRAQNDLADLERERLNLELEIGDAIRTQGVELDKIVGISADITRSRAAFAVPFFERFPAPQTPKPRGGGSGGGKQTLEQGRDAVLGTGKWAQPDDKLEAIIGDPSTRWLERKVAEEERLVERSLALAAAMGEGWEEIVPLAKMATDAEKLRDALQGVADATGLVAAAMPELGDALSEVNAIVNKVAAANGSLTDALPAMGAALAANAAKAVGGVRAEAAVRAAYEVGMGFATLINPVESAGHFTAAALLGAVALGAGGGGGKKSSGGGSSGGGASGGSQGNSGPSTIVYNFSTLVTDRQQVTTAIRQSTRASAGTGASSRAGV